MFGGKQYLKALVAGDWLVALGLGNSVVRSREVMS